MWSLLRLHNHGPPRNSLRENGEYSWIVMEGRVEKEGVHLVAICYKYNKSKVLVFISSKEAGSIVHGEPYEARFLTCLGTFV